MSQPDTVLEVDGKPYAGWKKVTIGLSIESISGSFELSVTDRWPLQAEKREIQPGAPCTMYMGDTAVITGYVDDVDVDYSSDDHRISIRGRDKTADVVDSAATYKSGTFHELGLLDIASRLCQPHSVTVTSKADLGKTFRKYSITPGDTIYETLELLARRRGVLLMPDNGNLLFNKPGTDRIETALKTGVNIKTGSIQRSIRERYGRYTVYGQTQGFDDANTDFAASPKGEATDNAVRASRHHISVAEGAATAADCEKRAIWARNTAVGRSQRAVYTVQGWTYNGRDLWPLNKLVAVDDDIANIHRDLLIVSLAFVQNNDRGTITELTLAPREAYDTIELPEPDNSDDWESGND